MPGRRGDWPGRVGLVCGFLLWVASIGALLSAVQANEAAGHALRVLGGLRARPLLAKMHAQAVAWSMALTALQIGAMLLAAFVLRAAYRLRTAVCFAVAGGALVGLDALWLLGLLVWLRMYGTTG